jgi:hypothetical protein
MNAYEASLKQKRDWNSALAYAVEEATYSPRYYPSTITASFVTWMFLLRLNKYERNIPKT